MGCNCFDRRTCVKAGIAGLVLTGAGGVFAAVNSLSSPVNYQAPQILEAGSPRDFLAGSMNNFQVGDRRVTVVKGSEGLYALVRNCTHMGCIPSFSETDNQFHCPCHGSIFTLTGDVVRGPAPAPLYRASLVINARGAVEINVAVQDNSPDKRGETPFLLEV